MATCLVVDDDPSIRRILRRGLEAAGARVVEAGDGAQAVCAAAREPVDLVILDKHMPLYDGESAFYFFRRNPETRRIPVMLLTGDLAGPDREPWLLEVDDWVSKPFDLEEVVHRAGAVIRRALLDGGGGPTPSSRRS